MHMSRLIKPISLILLLLGFGTASNADKPAGREPSCAAFIRIEGNTNLNTFELMYSFRDESVVLHSSSGSTPADLQKIKIPVRDFRGDSKAMERDFHQLVKSEQHPAIVIDFKGFRELNSREGNYMAMVNITMAGITRSYSIPVRIHSHREGSLCLQGKKAIRITDFNLQPPEKFFGLVEVRDYIHIDFSFNFIPDKPRNFLSTNEIQY